MATRRQPAPTAAAAVATAAALRSSEINEIIEVAVSAPMDGYPGQTDCKWGLPLLIEGDSGIAKTARIKSVATSLQTVLATIYAAPHPPEDFGGALIPDGKGDANQIAPLPQIRKMVKEKAGILFFDEINGAMPATQGALMSLIHERHTGDVDIPPRVRIVAAMNPEEIAACGFRLSPPLANRFIHVSDPGPDAREWTTWLMGSSATKLQGSLDAIERVVIEEWPNKYPETQSLFAGFIESNPSLLHKRPAMSDPQSGKAWPSHRTWDFATRGWTTAIIIEKNDAIRDAMVEACVGAGAAEELIRYFREADIPKPMEVLKNQWKINRNRLDIVLAAYTGAVAYVRQRPTRDEKEDLAPLAWEAIARLFEAELSDIVIPAVEGLIQERLGHNSGNKSIKTAANKVLVPLSKSGLAKYLDERT
jgi:hypothetical protein